MIGAADPMSQVNIHLVGVCLDCLVKHDYGPQTPSNWLKRMDDWRNKHLGHRIEFRSPERTGRRNFTREQEKVWEEANNGPWWLDFNGNADVKLAYASSADYTITVASLVSSGTLVAGRESTAVSNTSDLYLDYLVAGKVRVGSSGTAAGTIEVWAYASMNDTPTYPDVLDGTDSDETFTSADIKRSCLKLIASIPNDATNSRTYPFAASSIAAAYGGLVPKNHGLFVVHSASSALSSTGSDHFFSYTGAYMTSS